MRFLLRLAIPLIILAATCDITLYIVTITRLADEESKPNLEQRVNKCRHTCVALPGAEKFMVDAETGRCLCGGELP